MLNRVLTLAALSVAASTLSFAQTATTTPVGFFKLTFAAGQTTSATAVLENDAVDLGTLSAIGSNTLTDGSKAWTASQFAGVAFPYVAQITTGTEAGRVFKITANTATVLTVDSAGIDLTTILVAGAKYRLVPIDTLGSLFGAATVPFQTGASAAAADNVLIWDIATQAWLTYFHNGTSWRRTGSLVNQNNTVILPDTALFVFRRGATPLEVVLTGAVPTVAPKFFLKPAASTFVGNPQPADTTLLNSGAAASPGWLTGASAASADNLLVWNGTGWFTFFHNGTSWRRTGSLVNQNTFVITAGTPMFVFRRSNPATNQSYLATPLAYTP